MFGYNITTINKNQKKKLKEKPSKNITFLLESMSIEYGIDRARYHGGDLKETSIIRLFQNANNIFKQFSSKLTKSLLMMIKKRKLKTMQWDIKICTLFDSLFSLSRTLTGKITTEIIDKVEIVIDKTMIYWRNLRLSTKMVKIHGIEDYLWDQIKKYNGLGCFIKDFIEQAQQFGMLDKKRTANMRDRIKA